MSKTTKIVKVYLEDWETLNKILSVLQAQKGQRLSFADAFHEVLRTSSEHYSEMIETWLSQALKRT